MRPFVGRHWRSTSAQKHRRMARADFASCVVLWELRAFFFFKPVMRLLILTSFQFWAKSSIFNAPQKIKSPDVAPRFISDLERNTHGVKVISRVLKAVPIVVNGEGEVVVYCLLEKIEGRDAKAHIRTPGCFQNRQTVEWKEDKGTAK